MKITGLSKRFVCLKKLLWLFVVFGISVTAGFAQEENQKLRYKGLAFGAYFTDSFAANKWSKYVTCTIGGGAGMEYTFLTDTPLLDAGLSLKAEYAVLLPASNNIIKGGSDISVFPGVFIRLPFFIGAATAAFQPELSYGVMFHRIKSDKAPELQALYVDQFLTVSSGLRLAMPGLLNLEIELAPLCTMVFEKNDLLLQAGFRAGAVWHLSTK